LLGLIEPVSQGNDSQKRNLMTLIGTMSTTTLLKSTADAAAESIRHIEVAFQGWYVLAKV